MRRKEDKAELRKQKASAGKKVKEGTAPAPLQEANTLYLQADMPRRPVGHRVEMPKVFDREARNHLADDSWYLSEIEGYGVPCPQSEERPEAKPNTTETNSMTTLAAMLRRNRRRK